MTAYSPLNLNVLLQYATVIKNNSLYGNHAATPVVHILQSVLTISELADIQ